MMSDYRDSEVWKLLVAEGLNGKTGAAGGSGQLRPPVTDAGGGETRIRLVWDMPMRKAAQRKTSAAFLTSIKGGK